MKGRDERQQDVPLTLDWRMRKRHCRQRAAACTSTGEGMQWGAGTHSSSKRKESRLGGRESAEDRASFSVHERIIGIGIRIH
jgi:hypothetical protein